ncbi:DUF2946 family protein [Burkholderiaceae bacterium DAT-1]|nr:DUF2946 family protein [Burkholderiaceae bacterium DAT-1]
MNLTRRVQHRVLLLVSLAMLMAALMPAAARVLLAKGLPVWQVVCSTPVAASGSAVLVAVDVPSPISALDAHGADCAWCLLHIDQVIPVADVQPQTLAMTGQSLIPSRFLSAPVTAFAWAPAQARAPPVTA